jgi:hypothetical protein
MTLALTRWETLEQYLFDYDKPGTDFSVYEYAEATGIDTIQASDHIQAYLGAQRGVRSKTLYVLRRVPGTRTKRARWAVGIRVQDARLHGATLGDDVRRRVIRAFRPDIQRIRTLNPRSAKSVEAQIEAVIAHAVPLLEMAASGMAPPGGWPQEDEE